MESLFECSTMIINPPHFHVIYQEEEALIDLKTLEIVEGNLPKEPRSLAIEWA